MAEHDPNKIVQSDAFKALNLLVDQQAAELRGVTYAFKDKIEHLLKAERPHGIPVPHVETRISYEIGDNRFSRRLAERPHVELAFDLLELKQLRWYLNECERLDRSLNELQKAKLRLVNDWDFTRGDNSDQIAVFGQPVDTTPK